MVWHFQNPEQLLRALAFLVVDFISYPKTRLLAAAMAKKGPKSALSFEPIFPLRPGCLGLLEAREAETTRVDRAGWEAQPNPTNMVKRCKHSKQQGSVWFWFLHSVRFLVSAGFRQAFLWGIPSDSVGTIALQCIWGGRDGLDSICAFHVDPAISAAVSACTRSFLWKDETPTACVSDATMPRPNLNTVVFLVETAGCTADFSGCSWSPGVLLLPRHRL